MSDARDRALAMRLLAWREQGGPTVISLVRANGWRYAIHLGILLALFAVTASAGLWSPAYVTLGALAAVVLRDIAWMRRVVAGWPFTLNVTDWATVEQIAAAAPSGG